MSLETINAIWFTGMMSYSPIGIVIVKDTITKEKKAYIGVGNGLSEENDTEKIKLGGAKLHKKTIQELLDILSEV